MSGAPVFCSIATRSHGGAARACLESAGAQHPGARLVLLTIGHTPDDAGAIEPLPLERVIAPRMLAAMRSRYSAAELCCAAKPFLIGHLLATGAAEVHYLDSDIFVYAPLAALQAQLATADLLLTPHCLTPIPEDGRTPSALTVLRAGAFNAGYLGVRNTADGERFAQWHAALTERNAFNQPDRGMCGDQRWLDLVPALFPGAAICREHGANVAYWNLHERELAAGHRVNGEALLFFHFSGYQPAKPDQLSIHQNRHRVRDNPALAALLDDYRRRLPAPSRARWWKRS